MSLVLIDVALPFAREEHVCEDQQSLCDSIHQQAGWICGYGPQHTCSLRDPDMSRVCRTRAQFGKVKVGMFANCHKKHALLPVQLIALRLEKDGGHPGGPGPPFIGVVCRDDPHARGLS